MNRSTIAVGSILIALLSACGPARSPLTRQYLLQVCGANDDLNQKLLGEPPPQAPQFPNFSAENNEEQAKALKTLSSQLAPYYAAAEETVKRVLALCDDAEAKSQSLDPKGADPAAAYLGLRHSDLIDRRQQLALQMEAQIAVWRNGLQKGFVPKFALKVTKAGMAALLTPNELAANLAEFQPTPEEASELIPQDNDVVKAIAAWRGDAIAETKARGEILASLKVKYPGDDWSFLAVKGGAQP